VFGCKLAAAAAAAPTVVVVVVVFVFKYLADSNNVAERIKISGDSLTDIQLDIFVDRGFGV